MERISIFVGHYGSGKTEVALNYGVELRKKGHQVILVDLDIVNPYYRTKDAEETLAQLGIEVLSPTFANTNVDLPSLPPDIFKVFSQKDRHVVFDVGGDEEGARALGRFFGYFSQESYRLYAVINTNRPLTETEDEIIMMIEGINLKSRLQINGLINNTNLSYETEVSDIINGEKIVLDVCHKLSLPFIFTSVREDLADQVKEKTSQPVFPIKKYLYLPWQVQ